MVIWYWPLSTRHQVDSDSNRSYTEADYVEERSNLNFNADQERVSNSQIKRKASTRLSQFIRTDSSFDLIRPVRRLALEQHHFPLNFFQLNLSPHLDRQRESCGVWQSQAAGEVMMTAERPHSAICITGPVIMPKSRERFGALGKQSSVLDQCSRLTTGYPGHSIATVQSTAYSPKVYSPKVYNPLPHSHHVALVTSSWSWWLAIASSCHFGLRLLACTGIFKADQAPNQIKSNRINSLARLPFGLNVFN